MKKFLFLVVISGIVLSSCRDEVKPAVAPRDMTINVSNSSNELFFDSTSMEAYISTKKIDDSLANRIRSFYNTRNYQFAWFDSSGLAEFAHSFLSARQQYISYSRDSSINNPFIR